MYQAGTFELMRRIDFISKSTLYNNITYATLWQNRLLSIIILRLGGTVGEKRRERERESELRWRGGEKEERSKGLGYFFGETE